MRAPSRWRFLMLSAVAVLLAAGALMAISTVQPAQGGASPRLVLPADNPARGLVYAGLDVGIANDCPGTYQIVGTDRCTHGPDPAPPGIDPSVRAVP